MRRLGGKVLDGVAVTLGWWLATLGIAGVFAAARKLQATVAARAQIVETAHRAAVSSGRQDHPSFRPHLRAATPWRDDRRP